MTAYYVDSVAANAGTGTTNWANSADTVLELMPLAAGDIVYFASDHSETKSDATMQITQSSGDPDLPVTFISTNDQTNSPPQTYTKGAKIITTSAFSIDFTTASTAWVFVGMEFESNRNIDGSGHQYFRAYDCSFTITTTTGNRDINFTFGDNIWAEFHNCSFTFNATTQGFQVASGSSLRLYDCTGTGSINDLITLCNRPKNIEIVGCDFSNATSITSDAQATPSSGVVEFSGYRTKFGTDLFGSTWTQMHSRGEFYACSTSTNHYDIWIEDALGTTTADTSVYRSAKYDGTNEYSLKTVTTATGIAGYLPHRYHLCDVWADANSTFTVHATALTASGLDKSSLWIEVAQPDLTGPLGTHTSTVDTDYGLGTPASLDTTSDTWTGEPASSSYYTMDVTVSGGTAGVHSIWVNIAPGSAITVYVDPHVDVT